MFVQWTVEQGSGGLSNLCPKSVRCARERSGAAANRRAGAAHRRRDRAAARLGAPLRAAVADADRRRVPALLGGRRQPGAPDARAARDRAFGEGSRRGRAGRADREREREPRPGRRQLRQAIERLDDAAVHTAFDRLLAEYSLDSVLEGVVLPLLRELGDGWARGDVSIAQEHFASNVLRGRLLGLARGWDRGAGPRAVLACPPGERHDLGLLIFGLALREHGWRITFLGADTPSDTLVETVRRVAPGGTRAGGDRSSPAGGGCGGGRRARRRPRPCGSGAPEATGSRRPLPRRVAARRGGGGRGGLDLAGE